VSDRARGLPGSRTATARSRRVPAASTIAAAILAGVLAAGCGGGSAQSGVRSASASNSASGLPAPPAAAPSTSASADTVTGSAQGVTATLHAASHHPRVGRPWPIQFTVTHGGRPARASVSYEYLYAGQVVARRSHYTFTGHFSDTFDWPASSVGYPLTVRAVIVSEGRTIDLDFPVQVGA
jgi:hypothetical protein